MISRRALLRAGAAAALLPRGGAWAAPMSTVEDWGAQAPGARGIPKGWREYETPGGHPAYDFEVVVDGEQRGLRLKGYADHSTIAKEVAVDLAATPMLRWSWKAVSFPAGADLRDKATSDATGHLFVVWPKFPALLRSRLLGYVWDEKLPVDTIVKSRKTHTVVFVVVRSGADELGRWRTEERDVPADYRRAFGDVADNPSVLALSIDTNDTRSSAEAIIGPIAFRGR